MLPRVFPLSELGQLSPLNLRPMATSPPPPLGRNFTLSMPVIPGRGVGSWKGGQPIFGRGVVVFGPPGGEQVMTF